MAKQKIRIDHPNIHKMVIYCPTCDRRHVLSKEVSHWVLEGTPEDWFDLLDDGLLYPTFVCKNPKCLFQKDIIVRRTSG